MWYVIILIFTKCLVRKRTFTSQFTNQPITCKKVEQKFHNTNDNSRNIKRYVDVKL